MVGMLTLRSSGLGLSPGRGHWVVFLDKLRLTLTVPLNPPRCKNGYQQIYAGGSPVMD